MTRYPKKNPKEQAGLTKVGSQWIGTAKEWDLASRLEEQAEGCPLCGDDVSDDPYHYVDTNYRPGCR